MMHVLCSTEPLPTLQVKYILCPRVKTIIIALPLYKMFCFTPTLTGLKHSFNLINIVFFQNLLQFRFVEFALYLHTIQICNLVRDRIRRYACLYSENLDRPRSQITLFECLFGIANSDLVTDYILPLWWHFLLQPLPNIIFVFYTHLIRRHPYASMISVIVRMYQILQYIDISLGVLICEIFPHFRFKSSIKSFHHRGFRVAVFCRIKANIIFSQHALKLFVERLCTLIGL